MYSVTLIINCLTECLANKITVLSGKECHPYKTAYIINRNIFYILSYDNK